MKGMTMNRMPQPHTTVVAIVVVILLAAGGVALAFGSDDSQTANCPSGQTLSVAKVNGDTFKQDELPNGSHVTDTVSGSGLDYTLVSGADRATLTVKGGTGTLEITCR